MASSGKRPGSWRLSGCHRFTLKSGLAVNSGRNDRRKRISLIANTPQNGRYVPRPFFYLTYALDGGRPYEILVS